MKMVSVVLPVYNGEENLEAAIDSVLRQSYQDLELIVVNDCSTDNTAQIIKRAAERDKRVHCITNETNQKLPESLNIGFDSAKGEYFTWTSDDNIYHEDALKVMVEALRQNPQAGMVYCDYTAVDENGTVLDGYCQGEPEELLWGNQIGACFLYRREAAQKIGKYDKSLFLAEDYDYWIRIWETSEIIHVQKKLYFYKIHAKSLTSTRAEEIRHQTIVVWMKHWKFICSKLHGIKEKCRFCDMMLKKENDTYRRDTYKNIVKRYPVYRFYKIIKPVRDRLKFITAGRKV